MPVYACGNVYEGLIGEMFVYHVGDVKLKGTATDHGPSENPPVSFIYMNLFNRTLSEIDHEITETVIS